MPELDQLVKTMRDYLMGGAVPHPFANTNLLNPALLEEVSSQLILSHPQKKKEILQRLLALKSALNQTHSPKCQFDMQPVSQDTFVVTSGAVQPGHVSGAARARKLFEGASHCTPKHRVRPRRVEEVPVGEWVAVGIACALIVALLVMIIWLNFSQKE